MKKLLISLALIAVVFLAGCVQKTAPEHSFEGIDCRNNMTCFSENLFKCSPAKVEFNQEMNGANVLVYMDVQGGNVSSCEIYQQIKSIEFPEDINPMEKIGMQMLIGADSTCIGPVDKLETNSFEEYDKYFNCSGTLYDLMKAANQQVEQAVENVTNDTEYEEEGRKTLEPTLN